MNTSYNMHPLYAIRETDLILDDNNKVYNLKIKDLATEEKPREKLLKFGPSVLSLGELLAIVLGVGTRKEDVLAMSSRLLKEYGEKAIFNQKDPRKLQEALDLPLAKSCQIVACFELGRRFFKTTGGKPLFIRTAQQVYDYVKEMRDLPKEHLRGIYLNSRYQVIHDEVLSIGSLTANIIHPREVFKPALEYLASALILVHNHPSGVAEPSEADISITRQLAEAGRILGITLIDHIIVTRNKFISIAINYDRE